MNRGSWEKNLRLMRSLSGHNKKSLLSRWRKWKWWIWRCLLRILSSNNQHVSQCFVFFSRISADLTFALLPHTRVGQRQHRFLQRLLNSKHCLIPEQEVDDCHDCNDFDNDCCLSLQQMLSSSWSCLLESPGQLYCSSCYSQWGLFSHWSSSRQWSFSLRRWSSLLQRSEWKGPRSYSL